MSTATQLAPSLLRVLLVGSQEEDFFLIREILDRGRSALPAELDHAGSLEAAKTMLQRGDYGLVLFEHETEDAAATRLLSEFLHTRGATPFILLTEHADEKAVAEIIQAGAYDCVERSQLMGPTWSAPFAAPSICMRPSSSGRYYRNNPCASFPTRSSKRRMRFLSRIAKASSNT